MLEALFRSRVTVKVLAYFLKDPRREEYLREISRGVSEPASAVRRELDRLEAFGLLRSRASGNHRYFAVAEDFPALPELQRLFLKTEGMIDYLKERFAGLEGVQLAFAYDDIAERPGAVVPAINVVVVGDVSKQKLTELVADVQAALSRRVSYLQYDPVQFGRLLERNDPILEVVLSREKVVLVANVAAKS